MQRLVSGVLKCFIDMLKFPESFGKPVAFTGESAGIWGGTIDRAAHSDFPVSHALYRAFIPECKALDEQVLVDPLNDRLATQARGFAKFARSDVST
jgi:NAD(P)H-dependent FMN reductase